MLKRGGPWESENDKNDKYVAWLLEGGFAVVAPDFEGMGPAGVAPSYGHPYYNRSSLGKSMVYAVIAAKAELGDKLSGAWASDGLSEGGMASLSAASESSAATGAGMNYLGAVAVAPVLRVPEICRTVWGQINAANQDSQEPIDIERVVFMNAEIAYLFKSAALAGYNIKVPDLFRTRMAERLADNNSLDQDNQEIMDEILAYQKAGGKLNEWPGTYSHGHVPFGLFVFLTENQGYFEQHKLPGKVLFVQGDADDTTPVRIARDTAAGIERAGTDVHYVELKNVGHYNAPLAGKDGIKAFYQQLFRLNPDL
jgi:pimeloyl-ACP methyl ester carboxylesterase